MVTLNCEEMLGKSNWQKKIEYPLRPRSILIHLWKNVCCHGDKFRF